MANKALQLTAVIEREGDWFVATCPEVDVVSQGKTIEEARSNLLGAVEGFFEAASEQEGFQEVRRKGSHIIMQKRQGSSTLTDQVQEDFDNVRVKM